MLDIRNLSISFFTRAGEIPAVMDFSTRVMPGESMGLVGEAHGGLTRPACTRVARQYPRGAEIRNVRQLTALRCRAPR